MRHHFVFQIISFKKYFYVSLCNNFLLFLWRPPIVVEALGNCPVCPPLYPALQRNYASNRRYWYEEVFC